MSAPPAPAPREASGLATPSDRPPEGPAAADPSAFLRIVTHDLHGPIAAVRTMVEVLARGHVGPLQPRQAEVVERIERRLASLQALVDDLVDLASVRAGAGEARVVVDLGAAVRDACTSIEAAGVGTAALNLCLASEPLPVAVKPGDLGLLLDHLLSNAVKYGAGRDVHVTVEALGRQARVLVADAGIGIPEDAVPHLFQPFFRAPNAAAAGAGSGLGLVIAKEAVERCGGTIDIESVEGAGTRVVVRLPLAQ